MNVYEQSVPVIPPHYRVNIGSICSRNNKRKINTIKSTREPCL